MLQRSIATRPDKTGAYARFRLHRSSDDQLSSRKSYLKARRFRVRAAQRKEQGIAAVAAKGIGGFRLGAVAVKAGLLARRLRPISWSVALLALIALIAWKSSTWSANEADGGTGPAASAGLEPGMHLYPVGERDAAPELEGTTLNGDAFALSDWAGEVVVINVWGSWCVPCRTETPELVRLANEYADRGVRFLGINIRDNSAAARAFEDRYKVPYPSLEDPDGRLLLNFRDVIPTSVVPSTVVIDRRGDVAARIIGAVTYPTMKGLLADEIATDGGAA